MPETKSEMRQRSPRSPFITLRKAIERADEFFRDHDRHAVRVDTATACWGYGAKSSGGRQTIATMILYELMQVSGSGQDRKVQLTENAWRYLVDERPEHRDPLLAKFALAPKVLSELWRVWGTKPPRDAECLRQLRSQRGFTETAASEIIAIYKYNIAFAKLAGSAPLPPSAEDKEALSYESSVSPIKKGEVKAAAGERELTTGLLSKDASFRLIVSGQVGVKEIERLIRKLELDKEILADPDNDEAAK
jgi:hypothetical protein